MSKPLLSDYTIEMAEYAKSGYRLVEVIQSNYDQQLEVVLEKDGVRHKVMLHEIFRDEEGFHGAIDIRQSPWSRDLRGYPT